MLYQQITEYPKASCKEKTYSQEKKSIKVIDWNSSGQFLASGDTTIKIWNFDGNNLKKHTDIKQGSDQLENLLFHPTNPDLLAAITKEHLRIWDIRSKNAVRQEKKEFYGPATWHPSGDVIACLTKQNKEQQITLFNMATKQEYNIPYAQPKDKSEKQQSFEIKCLQYDPLGDVLIVGGQQNGNGIFQLLNAFSPEQPPLEVFDTHQSAITSIAFSKSGNYMATGGADALILLWSVPEMLNVASFFSLESEIKSLSFSFDEKWLSACGSEEIMFIFSIERGLTGQTDHIDSVKCEGQTPQNVVYHPNKPVVAFVCQDSKDSVVRLYGPLSA